MNQLTPKQIDLRKDHQRKDGAVFTFFKEAMEDIGSIFAIDDQKRNYTAERTQMICVFAFIDILASYWYEYLNQQGTPKERYLAWYQRYCINKDNKEYGNTDFKLLTAKDCYALRNSMVHFLGIAEAESDYKFVLATNRIPDEQIRKFTDGFKKRGHTVIIIRPKKFYNLVLEGAILMLDDWRGIINQAQTDTVKKWEHIEGIDRIYNKTRTEGAAKVPLPE